MLKKASYVISFLTLCWNNQPNSGKSALLREGYTINTKNETMSLVRKEAEKARKPHIGFQKSVMNNFPNEGRHSGEKEAHINRLEALLLQRVVLTLLSERNDGCEIISKSADEVLLGHKRFNDDACFLEGIMIHWENVIDRLQNSSKPTDR